MASKTIASTALFLCFNLLFFTLVSSNYAPCPPPPKTPKRPSIPPKTKPPPAPYDEPEAYCPRDTLKLGVCANLLNDLLGIVIGTPPTTPCCSLIEDLLDVEAAACLCTVIQANIAGINLRVPVALSLLLSKCQKKVPPGFQCAAY